MWTKIKSFETKKKTYSASGAFRFLAETLEKRKHGHESKETI